MISCKLYGRLANQLFQMSAAICHAWKMGTDFSIPRQSISPRIWPTYITNLPYSKSTQQHYYKEESHEYKPLPEHDDLLIDGYFQSEKYWNGEKERLAELLQFRLPPNPRSDLFVAVHVRRGDYLKYPDQFPVLPVSYYYDAIGKMKSLGRNRFIFFSDDIPWCESSFSSFGKNEKLDFTFKPAGPPLADMYIMYCAEAFIIANSTYSLFPALLRNDNPLVIAPAEYRWFGPANKNISVKDKMNEQWIRI